MNFRDWADDGWRAPAIPKPAHVFGRDREWAALSRFATDERDLATVGVVSGLRRQGKTYLLHALTGALGGLYFEAAPATERESLRMFGAAVGRRIGAGAQLDFATWNEAVEYVFALAQHRSGLVVIDEFPLLTKTSLGLPGLLRTALHASGNGGHSRTRLLLSGTPNSAMSKLAEDRADANGGAGLELVVSPLDYRESAQFWNVSDSRLAVLLHSVVGGTPAYRRQFVRDDIPVDLDDFDGWVIRTALNPTTPLFREARYLLADELDVRDLALYHSVLAAVAEGNTSWGRIAAYIGRRTADIAHPIGVLEERGLLAREADPFRTGRSSYRITEPLIAFYQAMMRPTWSRLEHGEGARVWHESVGRFNSLVVGPHFTHLCRTFARSAPDKLFGTVAGEVAAVSPGVVADPSRRTRLPIEVAVVGPIRAGQPRRVHSLGAAAWKEVMGLDTLSRLRRARDLLGSRSFDTEGTVLACYSAAGFDAELRAAAEQHGVLLVDLDQLYG